MKPRQPWSFGQVRHPWRAGTLLAVCALLGNGCMGLERNSVEKQLMTDKNPPSRSEGVVDHYRIACPDVIEIKIGGRPELSGIQVIAPDGRIDLKDYGRLRIEGRTLAGAAQLVAEEVGAPASAVRLRITVFRSQHLILFGQIVGWQRTIPYQGQETVLDVLQRVGGITAGAAAEKVYVVRAHLSDGQRPEVFHVDLDKIVVQRDHETNIRVLPFDQIYVGETRQARVENAVPHWLRPFYQVFWDTRRSAASQEAPGRPEPSRWVAGSERDLGVRLLSGGR